MLLSLLTSATLPLQPFCGANFISRTGRESREVDGEGGGVVDMGAGEDGGVVEVAVEGVEEGVEVALCLDFCVVWSLSVF
ncbi:hypothetical protein S245_038149 [Arachis hypogaea]